MGAEEYMCVNERKANGTVRFQRVEVKSLQEFKHLGSTVQSDGGVLKRGEESRWGSVFQVISDRMVAVRVNKKIYKTVVRPVFLHGLKTATLTKSQEAVSIFLGSEYI